MPEHSDHDVSNRLLRMLPPASMREVASHLEPIDMPHGEVVFEEGEPNHWLIFPDRCTMASMICVNENGDMAEVGLVGSEGVLGVPVLLGAADSGHRVLVQIPGTAWRMKAAVGQRMFENDVAFRSTCLRYLNFLMLQLSQTALCNRLHPVEERLARWLLLTAERAESDQLPLTHEMLSHMLGTRRATVTLTASMFQEAGLIRYQRGRITIIHRKNLEQAACNCYRVQQGNLRRLLARK